MFSRNVGGIDRILRIVIGAVLLVGFFLGWGGAYNWALLIGIVPLATGLMGSCLLYRLFGVSTCPVNRA